MHGVISLPDVTSYDYDYFFTSGDLSISHLLITFANNLDADQDGHNVDLDLDLNRLSLIVFLKELFWKS